MVDEAPYATLLGTVGHECVLFALNQPQHFARSIFEKISRFIRRCNISTMARPARPGWWMKRRSLKLFGPKKHTLMTVPSNVICGASSII